MTRYTMPARSQGKLYTQRVVSSFAEKDAHLWVFAYGMDPDVETLVRKWLVQRLDSFYCDLQVMYLPHVVGPALARTHIVLNNTPPLPSVARDDEAVEVNARGMNALDAVKALIKATGLNPHMTVCGWPFCLDDLGGVDDEETPIPGYHVLWPGKPTTNTVWTAVEDYTWFEAFSEEGCATGIACTPAPHIQSKRKTIDERSEG